MLRGLILGLFALRDANGVPQRRDNAIWRKLISQCIPERRWKAGTSMSDFLSDSPISSTKSTGMVTAFYYGCSTGATRRAPVEHPQNKADW